MGRNLPQSPDSDMVQSALALESGKYTFHGSSLGVQSLPLGRLLLIAMQGLSQLRSQQSASSFGSASLQGVIPKIP